jgi:hypothetical protein
MSRSRYCQCNSGSVAKIGGYHGFGTTTDYMFEKQRVKYRLRDIIITIRTLGLTENCLCFAVLIRRLMPRSRYVYTWEVFGDLQAHNNDCFRMFNPVTEAAYEDNVNRWAAAVLSLAAEVVSRERHVSIEADVTAATASATSAPSTPVSAVSHPPTAALAGQAATASAATSSAPVVSVAQAVELGAQSSSQRPDTARDAGIVAGAVFVGWALLRCTWKVVGSFSR